MVSRRGNSKNQKLENDLRSKDQHIQSIEEDSKKLKQYSEELQWYLGEEKGKRLESDNSLKDSVLRLHEMEFQLNQLRTQLETAQKELQRTQWYLGEERAKHASKDGAS